MTAPPLLVLDTNVCLDLYVFGNPHCAPLKAALAAGAALALTDAACRAEWLRVLDYPQLALDAARRAAAQAQFDAQLRLWMQGAPVAAPALPRCRDPDDQKFLELAQACGARCLLTRDNALLKLARHTRREHGFDILTPQAYAASGASAKPV
jgi:predicted nucleic acid-binding protein